MVVSKPTTCDGKNIGRANATTPNEQAMAEALAKRKKKLEKEYKENIDGNDTIVFRSPMLANEYKKEEIDFPVYTQPKLDGVRCVATKDGLFTRNGKVIYSCPHIIEELKPLFKENPSLELDGELYNHDLKDNFDELISIIKQQKPTPEDLKKSEEMLEYHVYDIRNEDKIFSERTDTLHQLVKWFKKTIYVETCEINSLKELDAKYDEWLEDGYEGQMIRTNTPYEFKRTNGLLKRKEFITEEFEIVDILEGKGNRSGMAGKVVVKLLKPTTEGVETCEANPKGGFAFYKRLLAEKETVIGKMVTIRFQAYTPKGSLRFPCAITIRDYE